MKLRVTFDELRPGDVLLQADDCNVSHPNPCTVERAANGRKFLELVKPRLITTEFNLYRDFASTYQIERPITVARKATATERTLALLAEAVRIEVRTQYVPGERIHDGIHVTHAPGGREHGEEKPVLGDVVLVPIGKFWRPAVVIEVGRKRVRVAYVTPHGVANARRYGIGGLAVMRPQVAIAAVYVVTGEKWVQTAIAGA